jgi:hypothetical protein
MTEFHFYPNKWDNKSEDCIEGAIQNKNGMRPSSCEEIEIEGEAETQCPRYKGYYVNRDDNGNIQSYTYFTCRKNHGLGDNACVRDIFTPASEVCQPYPMKGTNYNDKMYYNNMGWMCEKTKDDKRVGLDQQYLPVNPIIRTDRNSIDTKTNVDFNNMCGNVWGNGFNNRCTQKDSIVWPDCQSLSSKNSCEAEDGCRWFNATQECQVQPCEDMARHDLMCSASLCDWEKNPQGDNEYITGPKGDPPRGYGGTPGTPSQFTYHCAKYGQERVCQAVPGHTGTYQDYDSCEKQCTNYTWKCNNGKCQAVWGDDPGGPGPYKNESDCVKSGCEAEYTFVCFEGKCSPIPGQAGDFKSEEDCLRKCAGKCCPDLDNPVVPPDVCTSVTDPQQCVMDGCKLQNHCRS